MRNRREAGAQYEALACAYLEESGAHILARNFRTRQGEIDIVVADGAYTAFVEVKYRSGTRCGTPEEAVHLRKQRTICRAADVYRMRHRLNDLTPVRFDVVSIRATGDGAAEVRWIRNAFSYHMR